MGPALLSRASPPNIRALRKIEIRDPQYGPLSSHDSEVPWIDSKGIVENPSYIFRPPKSKHIIGGLAIIALILNRQAPKLIIGDTFNKGGPT